MTAARIARLLTLRYGAFAAAVRIAGRRAVWCDRLERTALDTPAMYRAASRVEFWRSVSDRLEKLHAPARRECKCRGEVGPCPDCARNAEPYSDAAARLAKNPKNATLHKD